MENSNIKSSPCSLSENMQKMSHLIKRNMYIEELKYGLDEAKVKFNQIKN